MELVLIDVERSEEGQALDMVPMIMGDEDVGLLGARGMLVVPAIAQHAQAGAAIENELRAIGSDEIEARGVAAEAPGGGIDGGRGATNAPKGEFGDRRTHCGRFGGESLP